MSHIDWRCNKGNPSARHSKLILTSIISSGGVRVSAMILANFRPSWYSQFLSLLYVYLNDGNLSEGRI